MLLQAERVTSPGSGDRSRSSSNHTSPSHRFKPLRRPVRVSEKKWLAMCTHANRDNPSLFPPTVLSLSFNMFSQVASFSVSNTPRDPNLEDRNEISLFTCGSSWRLPPNSESPITNPLVCLEVLSRSLLCQITLRLCNDGTTVGMHSCASGIDERAVCSAGQGTA